MAVRKKNAFKAREKQYARMDGDMHPGQVTIIGRPNSKLQKLFDEVVKRAKGDIGYNVDFYDGGKLRTVNHGFDQYGESEIGSFKSDLEEAGYKVRMNKWDKPLSIYNPKDGSNYRISYGGRDANGKPIRFGNTPIDPTKKSTLKGMGLSVG